MSARSVKQLEKLLHQESLADARNTAIAEKRLQMAEKALQKSIKETEKAQKEVEKAAKYELKTSKDLHAAQDKLKQAMVKREDAEKNLADTSQRADLEQQDIQQRFQQLDEAYSSFNVKEHERIRQVDELHVRQAAGLSGQNGAADGSNDA